jgi:ABC-type ATPase with predicted acetyltransferase domain
MKDQFEALRKIFREMKNDEKENLKMAKMIKIMAEPLSNDTEMSNILQARIDLKTSKAKELIRSLDLMIVNTTDLEEIIEKYDTIEEGNFNDFQEYINKQ